MGAIFNQLNRGESVTSGLKKVDKSQMTHKNPSLRSGGVVPDRTSSPDGLSRSRSKGPETKPKPEAMRTKGGATPKKEGRKEQDGNKWFIVSPSVRNARVIVLTFVGQFRRSASSY